MQISLDRNMGVCFNGIRINKEVIMDNLNENKTLLKVTRQDLTSPFQSDFKYEIGKKEVCKNFDKSNNVCAPGFYATEIDGLPYTFRHLRGDRVFDCAVGGESREFDQYKRRYAEFELLPREYSYDEIKQMALEAEERLGYKLSEVLFPINPLLLPSRNVTYADILLLKQWASVWASVRASVMDSVRDSVRASVMDSVWDSVRDSVRASVMDSVWASVRDSVWASVRDSVWAYNGSFFPKITIWKYVDNTDGVYPFQPCVDLRKSGLVPSFDGESWRLHSGKDAAVVWEGKL